MFKTIVIFFIALFLGWIGSKADSIISRKNSSLEWDVMVATAELENFGIDHGQTEKQRYCSDLEVARGKINEIQSWYVEADDIFFLKTSESIRTKAFEVIHRFEEIPKKYNNCKDI